MTDRVNSFLPPLKFVGPRCPKCRHMVDTPMHELGCEPTERRLLDAHITDSNLSGEDVQSITAALDGNKRLRRDRNEAVDALGAVIEALCEIGDKNLLRVPAVERALEIAETTLGELGEQ